MEDLATPRTTVHLLSEKSMKHKRDIFLFSDFPGKSFSLIGGMNSRRYKLTIAQFYQWLDILDDRKPKIDFLIWKINVDRFDVLCYVCKRVGIPLPRSSNEKMEPGDYAVYSDDGSGKPKVKVIGPRAFPTFRQREITTRQRMQECPETAELLRHNVMTEEIIGQVKARDEGVCWLTDEAANSTVVSWIIPPLWSKQVHSVERYDEDRDNEIIEGHKLSGNAITLDARLAKPFMLNAFGVDVDNNYRIVKFRNAPKGVPLQKFLPERCIAISKQHNDRFLREQFKWCLGVQFLGGDVREDYPDGGAGLIDEAADFGIDLDDPKWHTPIGREIREVLEMHEEAS
ncbi:hypothetical protein M413DRAFT_449271 [Hebeloma cylindrosporum]|uniref:Uncharacterized protein n=1 Tax=Hebeloma cylindrosporum TaxID=76867 RepID=A0A0C3BXP9_HEBCY|nr:hypothetical protein M413DRAFT_449271 [Hebeloma cylindrosporum h7]